MNYCRYIILDFEIGKSFNEAINYKKIRQFGIDHLTDLDICDIAADAYSIYKKSELDYWIDKRFVTFRIWFNSETKFTDFKVKIKLDPIFSVVHDH